MFIETTGAGGAGAADATGAGFPHRSRDWLLKRLIDVVGSLAMLVVLAPVLLFVAVGVWLSSPGPVIYSQQRLGRHGRLFESLKFRSMRAGADSVLASFLDSCPDARTKWEKYQKLENDPRITAFGRLIRRYSLDELPQLFNILRGDMSLVGPRPCMPHQQPLYGAAWILYCAVRPGLTGLWQVSGRNKLTYGERVALDAKYVVHWSLWLDLKILVKTIRVVCIADGAH